MHPTLMQDLARQRTAALESEAAHDRFIAIARSARRDSVGQAVPSHLGRLAQVVGRLRFAVRGSAG